MTFYQGFGDFTREIYVWRTSARMRRTSGVSSRGLTVNYGVRYERINPFTEAEDRLNGFVPGMQSTVRPDAPRGLVFPGEPGISRGSRTAPTPLCRASAWSGSPTGSGIWSVR